MDAGNHAAQGRTTSRTLKSRNKARQYHTDKTTQKTFYEANPDDLDEIWGPAMSITGGSSVGGVGGKAGKAGKRSTRKVTGSGIASEGTGHNEGTGDGKAPRRKRPSAISPGGGGGPLNKRVKDFS